MIEYRNNRMKIIDVAERINRSKYRKRFAFIEDIMGDTPNVRRYARDFDEDYHDKIVDDVVNSFDYVHIHVTSGQLLVTSIYGVHPSSELQIIMHSLVNGSKTARENDIVELITNMMFSDNQTSLDDMLFNHVVRMADESGIIFEKIKDMDEQALNQLDDVQINAIHHHMRACISDAESHADVLKAQKEAIALGNKILRIINEISTVVYEYNRNVEKKFIQYVEKIESKRQ